MAAASGCGEENGTLVLQQFDISDFEVLDDSP